MQKLITAIFVDIGTGVTLTVLFGFLLAACSALLNQCSQIFERAEVSRNLDLMGVPKRVAILSGWASLLGPMLLGSFICVSITGLLASISSAQTSQGQVMNEMTQSPAITFIPLFGLLCGGFALVLVAMIATLPINTLVLRQNKRNE